MRTSGGTSTAVGRVALRSGAPGTGGTARGGASYAGLRSCRGRDAGCALAAGIDDGRGSMGEAGRPRGRTSGATDRRACGDGGFVSGGVGAGSGLRDALSEAGPGSPRRVSAARATGRGAGGCGRAAGGRPDAGWAAPRGALRTSAAERGSGCAPAAATVRGKSRRSTPLGAGMARGRCSELCCECVFGSGAPVATARTVIPWPVPGLAEAGGLTASFGLSGGGGDGSGSGGAGGPPRRASTRCSTAAPVPVSPTAEKPVGAASGRNNGRGGSSGATAPPPARSGTAICRK